MKSAYSLLLLPALSLGQADWSQIHPHRVGYGSGTFYPGSNSAMARHGADLYLSGLYVDNGFNTPSSYANHYARLRMTAAETTLTLIKANWWHNLTPGFGETIRDSAINLTDPTPPNRKPLFTVAGNHLYQVGGQNYRIDPRRTFQPAGVNVSTDEITLDGSGSPVTPYTHLDEVTVRTTGTLPGGLSAATAYYILRVSGTTVKLASSVANARAGIAVDLTSTGTGVDSLIRSAYHPSDLWRLNLDSTALDYATWTQLFPPAATTFQAGAFDGLSLVWDPHRNMLLASNLTAQTYGSKRTWTLDLSTTAWTEGSQSVGSATAPYTQSGQQLTFNTRDSTAWLFGAGVYDVGGNELWRYQPATGQWTKLTAVSPRPAVRTNHCVAYVQGETAADDMLFVTGGTSDGVARRDSWVYNIQSNTWDSLEVATLPTGGLGHCQWEPTGGRIVLQVDTTFWVYPIGAADTTPVVAITSPADGYLTNQGSVAVAWEVNGMPQSTQTSETLALEGANLVIRCSGAVCDTVTVTRDQTPPAVVITSPASSHITNSSSVMVKWTVDAVPDSQVYALNPGTNLIVVTSLPDAAGNIGADTISVTRGTFTSGHPIFPAGATLTASNIRSTSMTLTWTAASADAGLKKYAIFANRSILAWVPGDRVTYNATGLLMNTSYEFRIEAIDSSDQMSINGPMRIFTTDDQIPTEPSLVASPIPNSQPTILSSAVSFLYEGANPIQTGQVDSLMDPIRTVVLRGVVRNRSGIVLPGATVSIVNQPEVGSTLSRNNGEFDLVVNGGGQLTVKFQAQNFLEAQRTVTSRWHEYIVLDTVSLVPMDSIVTTVDLSPGQPLQVAQASVVTDDNGSRQATLLIPSNTTASLVFSDGSTQPLDSMRVRATEYTVGENGPSAMPGKLPFNSAYTYAVEYTVDEAIAANAEEVVFGNPIYGYVENFIGFPVGTPVPAGYYDKKKGVWVPIDDGRVIKIAAINAGKADLVVDTTGTTASDSYLDSLGITNAERTKLAELYAVEATLWRVPLRHFSTLDYNWPVPLPADAETPAASTPKVDMNMTSCPERAGSIIDCNRQSLGESVKFPGLPSINYRSSRVPTPRWNRLEVAVTGENVPASVTRIGLDVTIAGRKFSYSYPRTTNLTQVVDWDGLDVYGRAVKGKQSYAYSISYSYIVAYGMPADPPRTESTGNLDWGPRSFAQPSRGSFQPSVPAISSYVLSDTYTGYLGSPNIDILGPGWTLDGHHVYDPLDGILHLGNGQDAGVQTGLGAMYTVVGGGGVWPLDGEPARTVRLGGINELDVGPDGSLYLADRENASIWKVGRDGIVREMAEGTQWFDVEVGPDESLYLTDFGWSVIWKRAPDGELSIIAGVPGIASFQGDGGPADSAYLHSPNNAVLGPDGSLYISDRGNNRVRKVTPDGIIQTVAGTGTVEFNGDSIPAIEANMSVRHIAVGGDGSIYVSDVDNCRIRRIDPSGVVTTVAGNGTSGTLGDGGPALEAQIVADRIEVVNTKSGGTLIYLSDELNNTIRLIDENGIINRIAGGGSSQSRDGIPATSVNISEPRGLAVDPNGNVYVGQLSLNGSEMVGRVWKVIGKFPDYSNQDFLVPSSGGAEVFRFSKEGRHLKTYNAYTGSELRSFGYDGTGRLTHMVDAYGNTTEIERDASGRATALVSPYNQSLGLNADDVGNLLEVTLPSGARHAFSYNAIGLMESYTTPGDHEYSFAYDSLGRLTRDDDPAGGFQTITRTDSTTGVRTIVNTALDRTTTYFVGSGQDKSRFNSIIDAIGLETNTTTSGDGKVLTSRPDGSSVQTEYFPEPHLDFQGMLAAKTITTLPSNTVNEIKASRDVVFEDSLNPLTLRAFFDTILINDSRLFKTKYVDSLRMWVFESSTNKRDTTFVDSLGNPVERRLLGVEPIFYSYDSRGRLQTITHGSGDSARVTTLEYSSLGYLSGIEDAEGRRYEFDYDPDGNPILETLPDGREVAYTYHEDRQSASLAPPGRNAHFFDYNAVGLDTLYEPPSLGAGIWNTSMGYNLDNQLLEINRPDGDSVVIGYDGAGRPISVTSSVGTIGLFYHPNTGQLDSISTPGGIDLRYTYDGMLVSSVSWSGEVNGTVEQIYDAYFFPVYQILNGADTLVSTQDTDGRLMTRGGLQIYWDFESGRYVGSSAGFVPDFIWYSKFGEISMQMLLGPNENLEWDSLFVANYDRDNLGRIVRKTETFAGTTKTFDYEYDLAGRLLNVLLDSVAISTFTYDSNGNRLTRVHPGGVDSGLYDAQDRMVRYGDADYSYSNHGDLQRKIVGIDTTEFEYDVFGNLLSVELPNGTEIEYLIDGQNRRVGKKVNGVVQQRLIYQDQLTPVAEVDSAGNVLSRYIYGYRTTVPEYMIKAGVGYRIFSDYLGSVRMVVNATTGAIVQRMEYDEFGNVLFDSNPGFQPFGFAGGIYDQQTELVRFGTRDYQADVGRWTTKDPIGFKGGDANLYIYVGNDPINHVDPKGLFAGPIHQPLPLPVPDFFDAYDQARGAVGDFWDNYNDMKKAWTIGADKYFHCMANCEATERGNIGEVVSKIISEGREGFDHYIKRDSPSECNEDRMANQIGRNGANAGMSCREACSEVRPPWLSPVW